MTSTEFYVYALKDPRHNPAVPFYIGKGTGSRAFDHLARLDLTRKSDRIRAIQEEELQPIVSILIEDLSEMQAAKLEAELIAALGTEDTGGLLSNAVIPSGVSARRRRKITIPSGVIEKAQLGLALLKDAVFELAKANRDGISNADTASVLGLRSEYQGGSKDYLSYSILGLLLREGKLEKTQAGRHITRLT